MAGTTTVSAQRMVLIEEFTNASCGPCASQNPDFNVLLDDNSFDVIAIKYQAPYPGFDPMNQQNPDQVSTRLDYYSGITGVPTAVLDGTIPGDAYGGGVGDWDVAGGGYAGGPYGFNQAVLDHAGDQGTSLSVAISHTLSMGNDTISISIDVTNNDTVDYYNSQTVLHTLILEKEINYPWAPGSNGEEEFSDVMRKMLPSDLGMALDTVKAGETVNYTLVDRLPDYIYNLAAVSTVAFIQNDGTKAVMNAGRSNPVALNGNPPNLSITDKSTELSDSPCDPTVIPACEITNNGTAEVTEFVVGYTLNDDSYGGTWTGSLMPGAAIEITFDTVMIEKGQTSIGYAVEIDGDYSVLDNVIAPDFALFIGSEGEEYDLDFGFEGLDFGEFPAEHFTMLNEENNLVGAVKKEDAGITYAIGGFGESETSMFVDFYSIQAGGENSILFTPENLTDFDSLFLNFNWAYAQYTSENDRLEVYVSVDCGETWTTIFDKAGADLATRSPLSSGRFFPTATEWESASLDLSDWANTNDVLIAFHTTSAYGNSLYLDDIKLARGAFVGVTELEGVSKFSIAPNPSNGITNLEFAVDRNLEGSINVINSTGRNVLNVFNGEVQNLQMELNLSALPTGLYFVEVRTEEGVKIKKMNLIR
jgi:hypothetical protein